jgi:hypothetical protein
MGRKRKEQPACSCIMHKRAETKYPGHTFLIDTRMDGWWRWECSCGRKGRWQGQSPSVSYHQWEDHLIRVNINPSRDYSVLSRDK